MKNIVLAYREPRRGRKIFVTISLLLVGIAWPAVAFGSSGLVDDREMSSDGRVFSEGSAWAVAFVVVNQGPVAVTVTEIFPPQMEFLSRFKPLMGGAPGDVSIVSGSMVTPFKPFRLRRGERRALGIRGWFRCPPRMRRIEAAEFYSFPNIKVRYRVLGFPRLFEMRFENSFEIELPKPFPDACPRSFAY